MQNIFRRQALLVCGLCFGLALFTFSITVPSAHAQTNCSLLRSGATPPAGFGLAWNPYGSTRALVLYTMCSGNTATLTIGRNANQLIYNRGFVFAGNGWQPITFEGNAAQGSDIWIVGPGTYTYRNAPPNTPIYWVGYMCIPYNGQWKCGCANTACNSPTWQLQGFQTAGATTNTTGATTGSTGGSTTGSAQPDRTMREFKNNQTLTIPFSTAFSDFSVTAQQFRARFNQGKAPNEQITLEEARSRLSGNLSKFFPHNAFGSTLTIRSGGNISASWKDSSGRNWSMFLTRDGDADGNLVSVVWPAGFRSKNDNADAFLDAMMRIHFDMPSADFEPFKTNLNEFR